jgi:hypothetical protein
MDDMGTPGPKHPAHRGLKAPDNVIKMPTNVEVQARLAKNKLVDKLRGKTIDGHLEDLANVPIEKMTPGAAARFDAHLESLMKEHEGRKAQLSKGMQEGSRHVPDYLSVATEKQPEGVSWIGEAHEIRARKETEKQFGIKIPKGDKDE